MPFEIKLRRTFAAAHAIVLYDGSLEPVHGHKWEAMVTVGSAELDSIGVVMDFHVLEQTLETILAPWRNRNLNDVEPFQTPGDGLNPTAENVALTIAKYVGVTLAERLKVLRVEVLEAPDCIAVWRAE